MNNEKITTTENNSPDNDVWNMSDVKNNLYSTLSTESKKEDALEVIDNVSAFKEFTAQATSLSARNLLYMVKPELWQEIINELTSETQVSHNRSICFERDDVWSYNAHLREEITASEQAHVLDQGKLQELAARLDQDRTLASMAQAAKYIFDQLEIPGSLKVSDIALDPTFNPLSDFTSLGAQSSWINDDGEYSTLIQLNLSVMQESNLDGWDLLGNIAHEMRHGYQAIQTYKLVTGDLNDLPEEKERAILYLFNKCNYIESSVDFDDYRYQLIEAEANSFEIEVRLARCNDWPFDADDRYKIFRKLLPWEEEEDDYPEEEDDYDDSWDEDETEDGYYEEEG